MLLPRPGFIWLLVGFSSLPVIWSCISTTTPTTTTKLCCTALTTSNPERIPAPSGTPGAAFDECAILRRIQRGECPTSAEIVCSASRGATVSEVVLQFLSPTNTVVAIFTGVTRTSATIECTSGGWRVRNGTSGNLVAYSTVSCTQDTVEGPDFTDYYTHHESEHHHYNDYYKG